MLSRRLLWIVPLCLLVAAAAYTGWLGWHVERDLSAAQTAAHQLRAAWQSGDQAAQRAASADLTDAAGRARSRADSAWWSALTHVPLVGDDADGVRALSRSLDTIATGAVAPLSQTVASLDGVVVNGRIDLASVARLQGPVSQAQEALTQADDELDGDSSGYVGVLRTKYDDFASLVGSLHDGLTAARTAVDVAPRMLGAHGPRNYLLIFQNNAEIRSTGGLPGSWALVHADGGRLSIVAQGAGNKFPVTNKVLSALTPEERAVYGAPFGQYFLDAGFTPDFPRAAQLWNAHWRLSHPDQPLDGVVALDPVALSYLLRGTGPVTVGDTTLTSDNIVEQLLSKSYIDLPVAQQDPYFQAVAGAVFQAATSHLASPVAFLQGLDRAAGEGRLQISAFDRGVQRQLSGTRVAGELAGDDGRTPHVDVGLDDLTGSKMSYYLRYDTDLRAMSCRDGVQTLTGSLDLRQAIAPEDAAKLPRYITGGGVYGTDPGSQYVMVYVYGPWNGSLDRLQLNGKEVKPEVHTIDGRPVASVDILLSSQKDSLLSWSATTGKGQTDAGVITATPSIVPGTDQHTFASACSG